MHLNKMIGQKVGSWTILEKIPIEKGETHTSYKCQCSCGNIKIVSGSNLSSGRTKQCWDCFKKVAYPDWSVYINQRFDRWIVIGIKKNKQQRSMFEVKCDCGSISTVETADLKHGRSKGCKKCSTPHKKKTPVEIVMSEKQP